jgi:putative type-1 restriction enzyme hindVIIP specificity protein
MMADWKELAVGDLCDTISDTYHRNDEMVVLVNTSDVLEGKILNHQPVENKNLKGQFKKTFKKDDILYSEIRPANKRYAYVDFAGTEHYIASTKLMVLRPKKDRVLPRFLFAFLSSNHVLAELQHLAETRSGTFPQITFSSELAPMPIALPDFNTQEKIVGMLSSIEWRIQNNNAINKNLELQVQTLFRNQFLTQEFLPDGWTRATLGEVSLMGAGGDKPKTVSATQTENCPYPIYSNGISDEGLYGFTNEYKIKDESITVSARGTIGFVCLRHIPYTPIVRLITLIPKTDVLSAKYLYLWLRNTHIHGTGTTQQQLTVPDFRKTDIILPTKEEMTLFTDTITPLFEAIWENQAQNLKLSNMRDTLLPKLMSGELDISNLDL